MLKDKQEELDENICIKLLSQEDRPREKVMDKGITQMSNAELLAILLRTGTKNANAISIAHKILKANDNALKKIFQNDIAGLKKLKGIGNAKAISIIAAIELGIRCYNEKSKESIFIKSASDVFSLFNPIIGLNKYEEFWVIYLSRSLKMLNKQVVGQGGVHTTAIDIKRIFKSAIEMLASSVILCHNHPSGNEQPSDIDKSITEKIKKAGETVEVKVLDHIIITDSNYYSFAENGIVF